MSLTYVGDSVLSAGARAPFTVQVSADGNAILGAPLSIRTSDSGVVTLTPTGDSIHAVSNGSAHLTIQLESPSFTDSLPTLLVSIRVHGILP